MTLRNGGRTRGACIVFALLVLAGGPPCASAQGTTLVPPTDLVYRDIDRLSELGVLDSLILGQRPYSRREIARIAAVARARLDGGARPGSHRVDEDAAVLAEGLLRRLETRFPDPETDASVGDPFAALVSGGALTALATDADRAPLVGEGALTEATIDPLAERRLGRPAVRGYTGSLELSHRIEPTAWLSVRARERIDRRRPDDTTLSRTQAELLLGSVRARVGNLAVTLGREQYAWAQLPGHGLFLASDAPALDAISLAGDRPFRLPLVFRRLGPTQATVILADLGGSRVRSHSQLLAYKLSVQPTSTLEIGGTFMNHFGGEGGRPASFGNRLIDFLPIIDIFRKHNYTDSSRALDVDSDKLIGADARLRLDALFGITVAGEILLDDFDVRQTQRLLTGYGSSNLGIIVPRLGTPALSLLVSAEHKGVITGTHSVLSNGITTRGRLLGTESGNDAKQYRLELRYTPTAAVRLELEGRTLLRSNARYTSYYSDPEQSNFVFVKTGRTADEQRDLLLGSLVLETDDGLALVLRGGGERTRNAAFRGGRRTDYVAQLSLRVGL